MASVPSDSFRCRVLWRLSVGIACLHVGLLSWSASTEAQVLVAAPVDGAVDEDEKNLGGFQVQVDDSLETSFKDFERFAPRKDWEKAFRAIEEIPSDKRVGMLEADGGLIVPARTLLWQVVADLPADGREAFRVFFDAKARELFSQIGKKDAEPGTDIKVAR